MGKSKITLSVMLENGNDAEAVEVAVQLFEVFWKSRFILSIDELSINGEAAYEQVRRACAQATASPQECNSQASR